MGVGEDDAGVDGDYYHYYGLGVGIESEHSGVGVESTC